MTHTEELARRWSAVMMNNYKVPPVALASGSGATVTDVDGREYTDLLGGMHRRQLTEFTLRAQVQPAADVLRSATTVA